MGLLGRLYRAQQEIEFSRIWRYGYMFSGLLIVLGGFCLVQRGLDLSIDFEGGSVWEVPAAGVDDSDLRGVLEDRGVVGGAKLQRVTEQGGEDFWRVQARVDDIDESLAIARDMAEVAGVDVDEVATNTVGPTWGDNISSKAWRALAVFLVFISLYIAWRLEWRMAIGALAAVAHDLVITVGLYAVTGWEVTPATVIAFLTILGYSLYDTIVVYDKVAEDVRKPRFARLPFTELMDHALNQVFMRSMNTTIVTILPLISLLVVGAAIMDQPALSEFSIALLAGLTVGAYSSIFVASPLVTVLKEREPAYRRIRERAGATASTAGPVTGRPSGAAKVGALVGAMDGEAVEGDEHDDRAATTTPEVAKEAEAAATSPGSSGGRVKTAPKPGASTLGPMGRPPQPRKPRKRR